MDSPALWLLILASGLATYVWRGLGVLLSGRLGTSSPLLEWVGCVAYAMVAGLVARILLMPTGELARSLVSDRLLVCALALAAYYATRRSLAAGTAVGFAAFWLLGLWRGLPA